MKKNGYGFILIATTASLAFGYQPVKNPLMTPWGEKMTADAAWPDYPRPNLVRSSWQNLNGLWDYSVSKRNNEQPKDWQGKILVPFCLESSLSGVKRLLDPEEQLWYRRTFSSHVKPGERLLLHFGAVDFRAQVFINGVEVTDVPHEGGNLPFSFDITTFVKPDRENELAVCVWDPTNSGGHFQAVGKQDIKPHGGSYTRVSGIWQTVWLESVPDAHVTGYQLLTDIDAGTVSVTLETAGNLMGATAKIVVVREGQTQASAEVKAWGSPVTLKLAKPLLWSPEAPNLYDLDITLQANGQIDHVKGYFGMRKIESRPDEKGVQRFFLNHAKTYLLGALDQGWWPDGLLTPPSEEAMRYDINFLKSCGFNLMRKHVKVEPLRYYYLCDKLGILVWQDMVSGGGHTDDRYTMYRQDLKDMVDLLQPFPCVILWGPYNEAWGQPDKAKTDQTIAWLKRYDPTRLVDSASGWNYTETGDARDVHTYPGPSLPDIRTNRLSVLGEFGGLGFGIRDHQWIPGKSWGYVKFQKAEEVYTRYEELMKQLAKFVTAGLAASIYTQTTDVEGEINGLVTYDRRNVKFDVAKLAKLHTILFEAVKETKLPVHCQIIATSEKDSVEWAYTQDQPPDNWTQLDFIDGGWLRGKAGFGNKDMSNHHKEVKICTPWEASTLWLRRSFDFNGDPNSTEFEFRIFYDDEAEIYLNGTLLARFREYLNRYERRLPEPGTVQHALRKGTNVIAVKVFNRKSDAFFDLGIQATTY